MQFTRAPLGSSWYPDRRKHALVQDLEDLNAISKMKRFVSLPFMFGYKPFCWGKKWHLLLSVLTIICFFVLLIPACLFNFLYYKNKSSLVSTFLSYKYGLTLNLEEDLRILKVSI